MMLRKILNSKSIIFHLLFCLVSYSYAQTTYNVTSTSYEGPGSLTEAINNANVNPGADIIEITAGLQIDASFNGAVSGSTPPMFIITESVTINGNGSSLQSSQLWINAIGNTNPLSDCPSTVQSTTVLKLSPGFVRVGTVGQDNTGVAVTIKDLTITQFSSVAQVRQNASLVFENFRANDTWSTLVCDNGSRPMVDVFLGGSLTLKNSKFVNGVNWSDNGFTAAIRSSTDGSNLTIENSLFYNINNGKQFAVDWQGDATAKVNIVSSRILGSGGIIINGSTSETNIVNSSWINNDASNPEFGDRIINNATGSMNIIASSMKWNANTCNQECQTNSYASLIESRNGVINLSESAIGFNFPTNTGTLIATLGGAGNGFTADVNTWIEPTSNQDASALQTVTSQANLITGTPGFVTQITTQVFFNDVELVAPDVSGVLIDVINTTLTNPIDNTAITTDVVGNERFDANGFRDIGAIQLALAPLLSITDSGDEFVDASWQEPLHHNNIPIVKYEISFVPSSGGTPTIIDVGLNTSSQIAGLTNGTEYELKVRAVYNNGGNEENGPFGNIEVETPYGNIETPTLTATPGDAQVSLSWNLPDLGGRNFSSYIILWKEDGSSNYTGGDVVSDQNTTTYDVTNLTNDTTYLFEVRATTIDGENSAYGTDTATPSATLSTEELTKEEIAFYPNPVNNVLQIKLQSSDIKTQLYSVNGKLLKEIRNEKSIDLSDLSVGVYFLKVTSENKVYSGKIIKK